MSAAEEEYDSIITRLMEADDETHREIMEGVTLPLHVAAQRGDSATLRTLLGGIRADAPPAIEADVEARDHDMTPLMCAAYGGHTECVRLLLDAGAEIDAVTVAVTGAMHEWGWTALMYAVYQPEIDFETVDLLLSRGADVNPVSEGGHTALTLALDTYRKLPEQVQAGRALAQRLRNAGLRVGIHEAALLGDTPAVLSFLDAGVDINSTSRIGTGGTPLMMAVWTGQIDTVRALLDAGADLRLQYGVFKGNALMLAAMMTRSAPDPAPGLALLRLLLDRGADVHARNAMNRTAMPALTRWTENDPGYRAVAELLREYGG